MARSESRTKTSIWQDEDFLALSVRAQRAYWMLYSQPTITLCGVVAMTPHRWANLAADETLDGVLMAIAELSNAGYVVLDGDTEELWVRTFIRHDGVAKSPKTLGAARLQLVMIASKTLRELVQAEFLRLADSGDTAPHTPFPNGRNTPSDTPSHRASDTPGDTPPDRALRARARGLQSPSPSPSPSKNGSVPDSGGIVAEVTSLAAGRERVEAYEAEFSECWHHYPRKIVRKAALRSYIATRRRGIAATELLTATRHFETAMASRQQEHMMHGSRFFGPNDEWRDYLEGVPESLGAVGGLQHPKETW